MGFKMKLFPKSASSNQPSTVHYKRQQEVKDLMQQWMVSKLQRHSTQKRLQFKIQNKKMTKIQKTNLLLQLRTKNDTRRLLKRPKIKSFFQRIHVCILRRLRLHPEIIRWPRESRISHFSIREIQYNQTWHKR